MLFNSLNFFIFLPIVYALYWIFSKYNYKWQNLVLLIASYYFYSCWDWRFLFLLIFSTFLDYSTGIKMYNAKGSASKKIWFWLSVIINLSFLGIFKYYNFFAENLATLFLSFGIKLDYLTLNVILPVGISFYTFHGLSYVIDIYKGRISPERSFIDYAVFVSFFPLLVAGPIERATHLLPQIQKKRQFNYQKSIDGLRQILWGLFKKVVIADQCAKFADLIFNNSQIYSGSDHVLGAIFFTFQIYCDFSGYSDIALGTARLFGIELLKNFAFPYFSRDIAEFWRRWHISLTTWFRDYLYIPLGGSRGGTWMKIRNTFIIFIVSGFWHGANWTFIFWGFLNALYFLPLMLFNRNRRNIDIIAKGKLIPGFRELFGMIVTFTLAVFAWIFFRAESLSGAFIYIDSIFSPSIFSIPTVQPYYLFVLLFVFLIIEWLGRENQYAIEKISNKLPRFGRVVAYYILIFLIFYFGGTNQSFIYFQF